MPLRLALLFVLAPLSPAVAAPCPPAAQIEGDEPLATSIREMLAKRGVGSEVELPCPAVHATVKETASGLTAVVRDESGRERAYELRDPGTAVAVVESWARHDLDGANLVARPRPAPSTVEGVRLPSTPERRPFSIAVAAGTGHGSEGSIWSDASVSACARFGNVCAGALARASRDSGEYGDADRYDTKRDAVDLLGTVHAMRHTGRWGWGGGLGFGFGWQNSQTERSVAGGDDDESFGGLRLEARAIGSAVLARELQLELTLAAGLSPLAHQDAVRNESAIVAAEPRLWLRTGIGLRFGGP